MLHFIINTIAFLSMGIVLVMHNITISTWAFWVVMLIIAVIHTNAVSMAVKRYRQLRG